MAPHDRLSRLFFENEEEGLLPAVLPHHLFMFAVAAAKNETGLYPLTGIEGSTKEKKENRPQLNASRLKSSEELVDSSQDGEEEEEKEVRLIIEMTCTVKQLEDGSGPSLSLLLRFEDKMNRQLSCTVGENETPMDLAMELVNYGLISELDRNKVANKIEEALKIAD